ncbi:hypothetical protein FSARC_14842 [Fusarium sarcochroum]|uniref:Uncharacterized protein n=1 Tax=Fusarium sarcochroum TaxID=1208366 RepID=A0A8H4SQ78_9HYPO|nr:hypothetical protein FSARC_14842 [Fusarium sarcochroum]
MTTTTTKTPPKRIFIFDNPRNRSHLFYRLLATHPQLKTHYHPYVNAGCFGPGKIHYSIFGNNPERTKLILIDYILSRNALDPATIYSNPTLLPDDLWKSVTPIIVIRHPALAFPSLHRSTSAIPALANLDPTENHNYWFANLAWSRLLFETLKSQGRTPVVVDGEDVCTRTDEVIKGVCNALGLDPAGVSDTWVPLGEDAEGFAHPVFKEMTRTIWESDGVKKHEPVGSVSLDDAVASIEKEYGTELAVNMRTVIEEQMQNYRYLEKFKV